MPIEAVHLAQPANRTDSPPSHASRNAVSQKQHQLLKTSCDVTAVYCRGLRAKTWYCPPSGKFVSHASTGRIIFNGRGKKKRKSVRSTSNPPALRSLAACGGLIFTAS